MGTGNQVYVTNVETKVQESSLCCHISLLEEGCVVHVTLLGDNNQILVPGTLPDLPVGTFSCC